MRAVEKNGGDGIRADSLSGRPAFERGDFDFVDDEGALNFVVEFHGRAADYRDGGDGIGGGDYEVDMICHTRIRAQQRGERLAGHLHEGPFVGGNSLGFPIDG